MTRPLIYDDMFINILKEKMHDKFFGLFNLKVQSTTFFQQFNLQKGLLLCALLDIIFGVLSFYLFFNFYRFHSENMSFLLENSMGVLCFFFGLIGLDAAINLKKINSSVYKNWRIIFTFIFFFIEIANNFNFLCFFKKDETTECKNLTSFIVFLCILFINFYITKIAWSFYIRLDQSHDLLIIHGKYLEKMINEDNLKYEANKKYSPPNQNTPNNNEPLSLLPKQTSTETPGFGVAGLKKDLTATSEIRLFKNENQITSGGSIRDSLKKDLKQN